MIANESTTRVDTQADADVGPGERLREAREAARLSVGEVASRLRLEPRVVESLESDDYDALHGATFVRGYLSGYARLLDLPDRPILEAYERRAIGPPALVSELGAKSEVHVSDFPVRMVTYVIAGLLVVLVVLWWQSRQPQVTVPEQAGKPAASVTAPATQSGEPESGGEMQQSPPVQPANPPVDVAAMPTAATTPPGQSGSGDGDASQAATAASTEQPEGARDRAPTEPEPEAAAAADAGDALADPNRVPAQPGTSATTVGQRQTEPAGERSGDAELVVFARDSGGVTSVREPGADAVADAGADQGPERASEQSSSEGPAGDIAAAPDAGDSAPESEPARAPRPDPLPGSDVLAIQLRQESWIEIYDRGGGRLYYSLAGEGSEIVVTGAGPMRVLLGEVEGAEVAYNGEPYDLSRFEGRSVVRFTVGERSDAAAPQPAAPRPTEEPLTRDADPPATTQSEGAVADAGGTLTTPVAGAPVPTAPAVPAPADGARQIPAAAAPALVTTRPDS